MKKILVSLVTLVTLAIPSHADEGMWTLYNLPNAVYEQMRMEGYQLPYDKLYQADDAIMKAVVNFSGYCSGVVVSPMAWCLPTTIAVSRPSAATLP
jgi:hypothetical protein